MAVSEAEVRSVERRFRELKRDFASATIVSSEIEHLRETLGCLAEVWQTVAGEEEQAILSAIISELESINIASSVESIKGIDVTISKTSMTKMAGSEFIGKGENE